MKKLKRIFPLFLIVLLLFSAGSPWGRAVESVAVNAKAAILLEPDTGRVLYALNEEDRVYPASTTKIMTALLLLEHGELTDEVMVSATSAQGMDPDGSSVSPALETGEKLTVEELLECILIASDNRACNVAAEYVSDSIEEFVALMNRRALELGCTGTHFANAHGLHSEDHYTTASDMARIGLAAMQNDKLMSVADTDKVTVGTTNLTEKERKLITTNHLISRIQDTRYYDGRFRGIKTGHTTPAGYCLVSTAKSGGMTLLSVVMGAAKDEENNLVGSFVETKKLVSWGFDSFKRMDLVKKGEVVAELPVSMSEERDYVLVQTEKALTELMPTDVDEEKLERTVELTSPEGLEAPVEQGQVLGTLKITCEDTDYGTVNLVAASSVSRSESLYWGQRIGEFFTSPVFWTVVILAIAAVIGYVVFVVRYNKRRKK